MKIFVTGGAGFIGGNFVLKQVLQEGNEVLNFDKLTYAGNLDTLKSVIGNDKYQFIQGDICQRSTVKNALSQFQPNVIINFAAESHVDRSIDGPFEFIQTNIVGTAVLLDEANNYYKTLTGEMKAEFRFCMFPQMRFMEVWEMMIISPKIQPTTQVHPILPLKLHLIIWCGPGTELLGYLS